MLQFRLQLILQLAGANFYHLHLRSPERIKELHNLSFGIEKFYSDFTFL